MVVKRFVTGKWRENCYVLSAGQDAVVVDPGGKADAVIRHAVAKRLKVRAIVNTHAHYDHVGAVAKLKRRFKAPFHLHSSDRKLLNHANLYRKIFDGACAVDIPSVDVPLDKVKRLSCGKLSLRVIPTPGHTPGSVCLLVEGKLFSGDLLFRGKVGRTDLPGGDRLKLKASLKKVGRLPKATVVYPGHGGATTIREEFRS